jgi:hypothetical protein
MLAPTVLAVGRSAAGCRGHSGMHAELPRLYEGTRLGRQELDAEPLEDTPGALWSHGSIEASRLRSAPQMTRVVAAIDRSPAGERIRSFAIITTEPNELCAELHNRMPVVPKPESWSVWLGEEPVGLSELKALRPHSNRCVERPTVSELHITPRRSPALADWIIRQSVWRPFRVLRASGRGQRRAGRRRLPSIRP